MLVIFSIEQDRGSRSPFIADSLQRPNGCALNLSAAKLPQFLRNGPFMPERIALPAINSPRNTDLAEAVTATGGIASTLWSASHL
jgi:hypothetical protein